MHARAITPWLAAAAAGPALAGIPTAHFGFEDLDPQVLTAPLELTSGPATVRLYTVDAEASIVADGDTPGLPGPWGGRALAVSGGAGSALVITFVGGVTGFAFDFGDFGTDDHDPVSFQVFAGADGTGALIDSGSYYWDGDLATDAPENLLFSFLAPTNAVGSVVIRSNSSAGDFSLLYDNLTVFVPAPGSAALLGVGLLAGFRRRR